MKRTLKRPLFFLLFTNRTVNGADMCRFAESFVSKAEIIFKIYTRTVANYTVGFVIYTKAFVRRTFVIDGNTDAFDSFAGQPESFARSPDNFAESRFEFVIRNLKFAIDDHFIAPSIGLEAEA